MLTKEFTPTSWAELQELLYFDSWTGGLGRFRSSYVYRGHNIKTYDLSTTLNRLGESHLENHLLRNFIKYAQLDERPNTVWNWLALAQHHGLPSRLLDWTYSPLVALHFATSDFENFDEDGAIWAINYVDTKNYLPEQLSKIIESEGSHIFTAEMMERTVSSLKQLRKLKKAPFAVFFEPPSLDNRIINQYAVFSLMSDPSITIDQWILNKEVANFKIIIPSELKWEIRDKLDQSNINERMLFPGLQGLAKWLKRHYWNARNEKPPLQGKIKI